MPLLTGYSPRILRDNIATLIREGKEEKQAVAIAYAKAREWVEFRLAMARLRNRKKQVRILTEALRALMVRERVD